MLFWGRLGIFHLTCKSLGRVHLRFCNPIRLEKHWFKFSFLRTMTYRWDSSFVRPYGWIEPRNIQESRAPTATNPYNLSYPQGNGTCLIHKKSKLELIEHNLGPDYIRLIPISTFCHLLASLIFYNKQMIYFMWRCF